MEAAQVRLSLHLSKCHIVGNPMHWLNYVLFCFLCVSGIFPSEYPETNRVSLFERWKMYGDPVEQKQMPVLSI